MGFITNRMMNAAAIMRVKSAEDAIAHANDTEFGLGAPIWTRDVAKAAVYARQIDAGAVFINGMVGLGPAPAVRRHQAFGIRP